MYYDKLKELGIELRNSRGQQKVVCPKCSPTRKNKREPCLSVNVTTGDYNCHNTGCDFRGTVRSDFKENKKKEYKKPSEDELANKGLSEGVKLFFKNRSISEETLNKFLIYSREEWMPQINGKTNVICFPYFDVDYKLANVKFRDKQKNFKLISGAKLIPYNVQTLNEKKFVIITEGEIDAMSVYEAGVGQQRVDNDTGEVFENYLDKWTVISVPNGASLSGNAKLEYIDNCAEILMGVTEFIIAVDGDEAGTALKEELQRRLGVEKCRNIKYPNIAVVPLANGMTRPPKDLNEVLIYMGKEAVRLCLTNSELTPVEGIYYVKDISESMIENFRNGIQLAPTTRFGSLDNNFRWKKGEVNLWTGYANAGKALCINTKIPTIDGFKTMGELKKGDKIFDENGNICNVTFVTPIMYDRECFKITFSDGTNVIADGEHLWNTHTVASRLSEKNRNKRILLQKENGFVLNDQTHKRVLPETRTTKQIIETLYVSSRGIENRPNHSIDIAKPLILNEKNLHIHPYVLGVWLGDGTSASGNITSNDIEVLEKIKYFGQPYKKLKADYSYGLPMLITKLRQIGVLNNKHIPSDYLRASYEQRLDLLRGLMDTDGYIDNNGTCEYTSISFNLASDVYELICSLGMKASLKESDAKLYGRIVSKRYRIIFKPNIQVFYLERKAVRCSLKRKNDWRYIKSIEKVESVPVKCISVDSPNKLYLCTESFIPTHNTTMFLQLALTKSIYDGWKWAIFSPENFPPNDFFDDLIEMYCGKWLKLITEEEYKNALSFLNDHFFYVYPEDSHDILAIHEKFRYLVLKHGIDGVLIDPFNQLDHLQKPMQREDQYLSNILKDVKRFALMNYLSYNIIAHPKTPSYNADKSLPVADMYDLYGGSMWGNKIDNILSYYRPNFHVDKNDPAVELWVQKVKRKRTGGELGCVFMRLDWVYKRFFIDGIHPCDPELAKRILEQEGREIYAQEQLEFENTTYPTISVQENSDEPPF